MSKAVKKAFNAKAKALLQLPSGIQVINIKCFQEYRPAKKEDKDSRKNKSNDISYADISNKKQLFFIQQTSSTQLKKY